MTNEAYSKTCKVKEIQKSLLYKLYELQKNGELCDYELTTKGGQIFKVHKWVLSTVSSFFANLFCYNGSKNTKSDLPIIQSAPANVIQKIIEFIYTGEVEISSDIVEEIINIAMFLDLYTLVDHCIKIQVEILNEENCLELLKFSETCVHYGAELTKESLKIVCKKFDEFVNAEDFCNLSSLTMKILVKQYRFSYTEEDLYLAVRKWITYDLESRENFIDDLIGEIQLEKCSRKFALAHILKNNSLLESPIFNHILLNHLGKIWKTSTIIKSTEEEKIPFIFSGNESNNECLEIKKSEIDNEVKPFVFHLENFSQYSKSNNKFSKAFKIKDINRKIYQEKVKPSEINK